ncbi:MAG: AI-2E family transporter [Lachnospiraceae bacterium]|nr:AI-2E family transporter [Lachnospiraceae bacterium]
MEKSKKKILFTMTIATVIVYLIFRYLFSWLAPVLLALAAGKVLLPFMKFLREKCHLPRTVSVVLPVGLFFAVFAWGLYYFVGVFCGQLVVFAKRLPVYQEMFNGGIDRLCGWCDEILFVEDGTVYAYISLKFNKVFEQITSEGVPKFTVGAFRLLKKILGFAGSCGIVLILTCMVGKDLEELKRKYRQSFYYEEIQMFLVPLKQVCLAYGKAQLIIISLIGAVCTLGFWLAGSKYALLFGVMVAIFDAFPVVGSGLILVPLAIYGIFQSNWVVAVIYIGMYLLCQCIRQFLEPKLIGNKIGIHPFFILLAVYFGVKAYGIWGVVLGPISFVVLQTLYGKLRENKG